MSAPISFPRAWLAKRRRPQAYGAVQIALHWAVAALVLEQYGTSAAILRTHVTHLIGQRQSPTDLLLHTMHIRLGLGLVALMIGRLVVRFWAGVPSPGDSGRTWNTRIAQWVHAAFYAVLIVEGLTGAIASYFWWPISAAHVILFKILLGLISVHIAAVVWHAVFLRDGTLSRMIPMRLFSKRG